MVSGRIHKRSSRSLCIHNTKQKTATLVATFQFSDTVTDFPYRAVPIGESNPATVAGLLSSLRGIPHK